MSFRRKILRYRKRKNIDVDRLAMPNANGAAARRRRKRRGEPAQVTRAVLKRVN